MDNAAPLKMSAAGFAASFLVATLEAVWSTIRAHAPDLPRAVIVVASGTEATTVPRWGHWGESRWHVENGERVGEVLLAGERLKGGAPAVLETLLHEAAHALAFSRQIKDTSRGGRYHNRRYRDLAMSLGLVVEQDRTYGWCQTSLGPGTEDRYAEVLGALATAIGEAHRAEVHSGRRRTTTGAKGGEAGGNDGTDVGAGDDKPRGRILLECGCQPPRKLRVSRSVAAQGPILCGCCDRRFGVRAAGTP